MDGAAAVCDSTGTRCGAGGRAGGGDTGTTGRGGTATTGLPCCPVPSGTRVGGAWAGSASRACPRSVISGAAGAGTRLALRCDESTGAVIAVSVAPATCSERDSERPRSAESTEPGERRLDSRSTPERGGRRVNDSPKTITARSIPTATRRRRYKIARSRRRDVAARGRSGTAGGAPTSDGGLGRGEGAMAGLARAAHSVWAVRRGATHASACRQISVHTGQRCRCGPRSVPGAVVKPAWGRHHGHQARRPARHGPS